MEFFVEKHSALPAGAQIQQQIKLALLLGSLRPGDTLPSIRDVEKQTGVSRAIVHKAYIALEKFGILSLKHGKGVLVETSLSYDGQNGIREQARLLTKETLSQVRQCGISPVAFARYFSQHAHEDENTAPFLVFADPTKALATEIASRISSTWHVTVAALAFEELSSLLNKRPTPIRKVLTNYLRLADVRQLVKRRRHQIEVIPVGLRFTEATVREFSKFPERTTLILIFHDADFSSVRFIIEQVRKLLLKPSIEVTAAPYSKICDLRKLADSSKYERVIIGTRLWNDISDPLKRHRRILRLESEVDLTSLENARIRAGVII